MGCAKSTNRLGSPELNKNALSGPANLAGPFLWAFGQYLSAEVIHMDRKEKNLLVFQIIMGVFPLILGLLQFHTETQVISDISRLMLTTPHDVAAEFGVAALALFIAGLIFGSALDGYLRWRAAHTKQQIGK